MNGHARQNPERPAEQVCRHLKTIRRAGHDLQDRDVGRPDPEARQSGQQLMPAIHIQALQAEEQHQGIRRREQKQGVHAAARSLRACWRARASAASASTNKEPLWRFQKSSL